MPTRSTSAASSSGHRVVGDWGYNPLVLYDASGNEPGAIVEHQVFAHLGGSSSLGTASRARLSCPLALYQTGDAPTANGSPSRLRDAPSATCGSCRCPPARRTRRHVHSAFGAALYLPTGSREQFTGDGDVRFAPRVSVAGGLGSSAIATAGDSASTTARSPRRRHDPARHEFTIAASAGALARQEAPRRTRDLRQHRRRLGLRETHDAARVASRRPLRVPTSARIRHGQRPHAWLGHARRPHRPQRRVDTGGRCGLGRRPHPRPRRRVPKIPACARTIRGPTAVRWRSRRRTVIATASPTTRTPARMCRASCTATRKERLPRRQRRRRRSRHRRRVSRCQASQRRSEKNGCPPDKDGDGIADGDDACPDVPGAKSEDPKKNGCPPDRDGDGIVDSATLVPTRQGRPTPIPARTAARSLASKTVRSRSSSRSSSRPAGRDPRRERADARRRGARSSRSIRSSRRCGSRATPTSRRSRDEQGPQRAARAASVVKWLVAAGIEQEAPGGEGLRRGEADRHQRHRGGPHRTTGASSSTSSRRPRRPRSRRRSRRRSLLRRSPERATRSADQGSNGFSETGGAGSFGSARRAFGRCGRRMARARAHLGGRRRGRRCLERAGRAHQAWRRLVRLRRRRCGGRGARRGGGSACAWCGRHGGHGSGGRGGRGRSRRRRWRTWRTCTGARGFGGRRPLASSRDVASDRDRGDDRGDHHERHPATPLGANGEGLVALRVGRDVASGSGSITGGVPGIATPLADDDAPPIHGIGSVFGPPALLRSRFRDARTRRRVRRRRRRRAAPHLDRRRRGRARGFVETRRTRATTYRSAPFASSSPRRGRRARRLEARVWKPAEVKISVSPVASTACVSAR